MLLFSTMISVVEAYHDDIFSSASKSSRGTWITSGTSSTPQPLDDWFRYDDGSCENSLGLTAGGTLYEVIKLTPEELGQWYWANFLAIKVMHGCPAYPGCPETPWTAWIYYGLNHPSNPETDATIIATGACPAMDDYFYVNFTRPYAFNTTDTVWLGIGWTHPAGSYPCGFDTDSCVAGKSDFLWFPGGQWYELGGIGYPGNWDFEVLVTSWGPDPLPPHTNCTITGTNPVTVTLTATDDDGVFATYYKLDGASSYTQYSSPFQVSVLGKHTINFYSIDVDGIQEELRTQDFTVQLPLTITIKGGFGLTTTIHNYGNSSLTVNGAVAVSGFVFPKSIAISGTILAGENLTINHTILGFGKTTITVTIDYNSAKKDAFVLLILIIPSQHM